MKRIVTFGEIMLRLSPEGYNRLFQNDRLLATFGGAEANVAVSLSNFGEQASFVTKIPRNAVGQSALNNLRAFGVDTDMISRGGDRLGIYYMEKGAAQRGSVCIYDREGSAFQKSEPTDYDWAKIFEDADWLHFTGITPALGDNVASICKEACVQAKERGITISCDINYRSKLWSKEKANAVMSELCNYVDVCIANEEDAKNVFGIEPENNDVFSGKLNKEGYQYVASELMKRFSFKKVAITLRTSHSASVNDWMCMLYDGEQYCYSKNYHIDYIVDRVGGGDSFGAGLIYSLHNGYNTQAAVEFAAAASALKHSINGDFNLVSAEEVKKLADGDGSGRVQR
ncbi:MAG: sugar kinase [Clostridia bacterium]|nr:sugar kinase [Clostridia bacterium]